LEPAPPPTLSRALLTPGPLPPLSHLGATLLRHAVATGLRYSLYQLGLPVPEAPPVRIVRLRLYLDGGKLERVLRGDPGGMEVAAALLDPGGAGRLPREAGRVAAAAAFHRARLTLSRAPAERLPRPAEPVAGEAAWPRLAAELSRMVQPASEALLGELLAALGRRARRTRGEKLPPRPSRAAADLLAGRSVPLDRFGVPDPLLPAWRERPGVETVERAQGDRLRGTFRETWRAALTRLAPLLAAHARAAVARGYIEKEEDACFVPLDLQEDLARERRPTWLEAAVRDNRAERESLLAAPCPPDLLRTGLEAGEPIRPEDWNLTPLLPLP